MINKLSHFSNISDEESTGTFGVVLPMSWNPKQREEGNPQVCKGEGISPENMTES